MTAVPTPIDQYDELDKRQIIEELERRPEGTSPRLVTSRYGVSPQLVMAWKQRMLEAAILNGADEVNAANSAPEIVEQTVVEPPDVRALELEIELLKSDNARLKRALHALIDR